MSPSTPPANRRAASSSAAAAGASASSSSFEDASSVPAPAVKKLGPLEVAKRERMRVHAVEELVTTERDYVGDLHLIIEEFLTPLRERADKIGVTKDDIDVLFSCVEILVTVNQEVLTDMSNKRLTIADVFKNMSPYLKMYTSYCINQPHALAKLEQLTKQNKGFYRFLEEAMAKPRARGLQLRAYLIKVCYISSSQSSGQVGR
jgi:RhoGEF domain